MAVDPFEGLPDEDRPTSVDKPWGGGIGKAEDLHQEYVRALEEWQRFERRNAAKIALWVAVRDVARRGRGRSSGLTAERVYELLGVDGAYTRMKDRGTTLPGGNALTFAPDASVQDVLLLTAYPRPNTIPESTEAEIGNEFVEFGRELGHLRSEPERRARALVAYLATGSESATGDGFIQLMRATRGQSPHTKGLKPTANGYNAFYADLYKKTYRQQVVVLREVTDRLAETETGRRFLASLFELGPDAVVDPLVLADPHVLEERDKGDRAGLGVHVHTRADYEAYFDPATGKARDVGASTGYGGVAEQLLALHNNLVPGLSYWIALKQGGADLGQATEKAAAFLGQVVARYVGADDVRPTDAAVADVLTEIQEGRKAWTLADVQALGGALAAGSDAILALALPAPDGKPTPRALHLTGGLKLLFTGLGVGLLIVSTVKAASSGKAPSWEQMAKDLHAALSAVADVETVGRFISKGAAGKNRVLNASKFVAKYSPVLATIGVLFSAVDAKKEYDDLDYDAAAAVGVMGLSGVLSGVGGVLATKAAAGAPALATPAGILVALGTTLFVVGYVVYGYVNDTDLETALRYSYFGKDWDGAAAETSPVARGRYEQPDKLYFRFRYKGGGGWNGPPNFNRQLSALASLGRPINVTKLEYDDDERTGTGSTIKDPDDDGTNDARDVQAAWLHLDPLGAVGGDHGKLDVFSDGEIYVVPLDIPYEGGAQPVRYKVASGEVTPLYGAGWPPLHRVRLGDWYKASDPTGSRYVMPHTEVPIYGWWEDEVKLRPEQTPTLAAVAPRASAGVKVHTWQGTFFATEGGAAGHVLGFSAAAIATGESWVEVVYLPPQVARMLRALTDRQRAATIRRSFEDWPMASRHRIKIDDTI